MIRFIYFDAGGTLLEARPSVGAVYARAGAAVGLDAAPERLDAAFREVWSGHVERLGNWPMTMGRDDQETRAWWRALVSDVLARVEYSGDVEACFSNLFDAFGNKEAWRVFDDVFHTLDALRARGARMGVLSNWDYRLPSLLEALELSHYFDPVLVSALEGLAKPDPQFFLRACERVGLSPPEVLYVGDSAKLDLEPALALGMPACLIDRVGGAGPNRIARLTEILAQLDSPPAAG